MTLERFLEAQHTDFDVAMRELRAGRKRSHWMWFVFPQIAGLGQSPTSRHFAISSLDEARAYLAHPLLGPRLIDAAQIVAELDGRTADEIFGGIDATKLRSSMTLFAYVDSANPIFGQVLEAYFGGIPDGATERLLGVGR